MEVRRSRFYCLTLTLLIGVGVRSSPASDALPPSAELAAILSKWKSAVSDLDRYEIRGHRILVNGVFETERQASVTIRYQAQTAIQMDINPCDVVPGQASLRTNRLMQSYRIEADDHLIFLWTPHEMQILRPGSGKRIDGELLSELVSRQKPARQNRPSSPSLPEPLDVDDLGIFDLRLIFAGWTDGFASSLAVTYWASSVDCFLLPAIFAVDEPGFLESFNWSAVRRENGTYRLTGQPKMARVQDNYQSLSVIVDETTGRPTAQKTVDPSGNLETIYVFTSWDAEPKRLELDVDHRKYDFELIPFPADADLLPHRRKKSTSLGTNHPRLRN